MNCVNLIGRQVRDSQVHTTPNGKKVLEGAIAVSKNVNEAVFINYTAYDKTADIIGGYVRKGDLLAIEGRIDVNNYQSKDGKNVQKFYVIVDKVTLCGARSEAVKREENLNKAADDFFGDM